MIQRKKLVTHNGSFHLDDLFATAVLSILNKGKIKIIRSRDPKEMAKGDYVYDVGGKYDPSKNLFDHHQKGGEGSRLNGIPYASFGLVWKNYGEKICGYREVAEIIDRKLVQPIDARDNGVDLFSSKFDGINPYSIENVFLANCPTWKEGNLKIDKIFKNQVKRAVELLIREIEIAKADWEAKKTILENYQKSKDKKIIILNKPFPRYLIQDTLAQLVEPIYVVYPSKHSSLWKIEAIHKNQNTLESRKLFPENWRSFLDDNLGLKKITGIDNIIFCHRSGFLSMVGSKENAIKLAQLALEN